MTVVDLWVNTLSAKAADAFLGRAGNEGIPDLLGGPQTLMIGKVLWDEFFTNRDWPVASAAAVILLALLLLPLALYDRLQRRQLEAR